MATRSLWGAKAKLALVATAVGSGATAATIANSDDPATALKLCTTVPVRLYRDVVTAATIAFGNSQVFPFILISISPICVRNRVCQIFRFTWFVL